MTNNSSYYNFSDEDEDVDQICNSAYDRWVQMGGGATGPLFKFQMKAIAKRRQWRNVVQRQNFNAEIMQLREPISGDNIGLALTEALHDAIAKELNRQQRPNHHFINFAITANAFQHAYQSTNFSVGEFKQRTVRLDEMLAKLAGKLNSNESFDPHHGFNVDVVMVSMPGRGTGHGKKHNAGQRCLDRENKKKKCIISIKNKDELCCARAIVTMKANCHKDDGVDGHRNWENLKRGLPVQEKQARELHNEACVAEGPCGLQEIKKFQQALGSDYQLLVMTRMKPFSLIFIGPSAPHQIRLLKSNNHYDGCTSFPAFVNKSYYCLDCEKGFNTNDKAHHPCRGKRCTACSRFDCKDYRPGTQASDHCTQCNTKFFGPSCKQHHFQTNQCQTHKTCLNCQAQYFVIKGKRHKCGYAQCPVCKQYVFITSHKCFIQPVAEEEEEEPEPTEEGGGCMVAPPPPLFVYADIEALQNHESVFQANLLCYSSSEEDVIHTLHGNDCILQFLQDLDDLAEVPDSDKFRQIIVVFHNLKGYDGMFIIHELYNQQRPVENQLTAGAKVLSFKSGPVKFIDSLCFLAMPLASFASTFSLTELKKGFFPHLFNTPENQQYVGRIPDLEFYDPDGMMQNRKNELLQWHAEQVRRNVQFNFKEELIAYCKSDVQLLKQGCQAFQREFESEAGFNPMEQAYTIASACNLYWRKNHLTPNTIAVEPIRGWRGAQVNQSLKALQWLYFQETQIPKHGACEDRIKHVRNGGEQTIRTASNLYFVDGYDHTTRTVYEFHGCLYHGCPSCYPLRDVKNYAAPDRTVEELYQATLSKRMALLRAGYTVIENWECLWDKQVQTNAFVQRFLNSLDLVAPLDPRDAFYGGRTGAVSLHAKAGEGEEIRYVDITSLYPWVNKNATYPVGHPHIITQPIDQDINSYFGIALVDILPPSALFHPVLPVRCGDKLTFPLCGACVREEQAKPLLERTQYCHHSDVQRMIRGTWCTPEIEKAVENGYRIIKIHEVWHFPSVQRKTSLFRNYVDKWLKIKQEASGWPAWCQSLEQKQTYILEYQQREGIRLDIGRIAKNPGRKATAKLMLNRYLFHVAFFHIVIPRLLILFFFFISCSFWGKFGERQNKPTTVTVKQPAHLFNILSDTTKEISTLRLCTDDVLEAVYSSVDDNAVKGTKTNIFVAAFTTSYARLKLYESLEILQHQVLYYDTDSVIYKWAPGQPSILTGDFLGDMKDELDGDVITEFVSAGAKNYSYKTREGKVECKVRGFTLNVRGAAVLNFQTMKANILQELNNPQHSRRTLDVLTPHYFQRDSEKKRIKVVPRIKQYGLVFDKRVINTDTKCSYPYGYERIEEEVNLLMNL